MVQRILHLGQVVTLRYIQRCDMAVSRYCLSQTLPAVLGQGNASDVVPPPPSPPPRASVFATPFSAVPEPKMQQ